MSPPKEEILEKLISGLGTRETPGCCCYRVLRGLQGCCNFISDALLISSFSLAGGGARSQLGSCGAFSGGLLALSAGLSPRSRDLSVEESAELEKTYETFGKFRDWFVQEFGDATCPGVMTKLFGRVYHVRHPDKKFEEKNASYGKKYVRNEESTAEL
jgi:hypothetical protein